MTVGRKSQAWAALGALVAVLAAVPSPATAGSATLTVVVENVRSPEGMLHIAIWNDADGFGDGDRSLAARVAPAHRGQQRIVFAELAPGHYAIAVYHDENGNGEFDRTLVGLPAEGLGFSNDAWIGLLGAPSFEEAAIALDGVAHDASVRLRY